MTHVYCTVEFFLIKYALDGGEDDERYTRPEPTKAR